MTEDLTALKDQLILRQQKKIAELKAENHQLKQDNIYIKKVLSIALRDCLRGTPLVISPERMAEADTEFSLDTNLGGDQLIWARRNP